jgi:hypothetical protein
MPSFEEQYRVIRKAVVGGRMPLDEARLVMASLEKRREVELAVRRMKQFGRVLVRSWERLEEEE